MSIEKTPFDPEQINPGDIICQKRVVNLDGTMAERSRWLVIDRHLPTLDSGMGSMEGSPVFNCLLLSFNPRNRADHWYIGTRCWIKPQSDDLWEVVVESGLSWGDD